MNILDIAIAKKLAGGGGGSGTDNYNDLSNLPKINDTTLSGNKSSSALGLQSEINSDSKLASDLVDDTNQDNKFVTSTEKNTWNAKQNAIDADHKLSSDLVDDANKTNKFVTSTEKNTWNAKQNAIDSDHKLSSDLVDDANKTNKFVTSTEKNTWNAKQNAIDADHKLSSSLVSFTDAEAAALASGINSSKVGQISTNQTNILYALEKVGKNVLHFESLKRTNVNYGRSIITNGVRFTINDDNTITVNRETASNEEAYIELCISGYDAFFADQYCDGEHYLSGCPSGGSDSTYRLYAAKSTYAKYDTGDGVLLTSTPITEISIVISVYNGYNAQNLVFKPMICTEETWNISHAYEPYGAPNYDLTYLQAEDRAALAEVVDSGAKNVARENNITYTGTNTAPAAECYCDSITGSIHVHIDKIQSTDTDSTLCYYRIIYNDDTYNEGNFNRDIVIDIDIYTNKVVKKIAIYPSSNAPKSIGDTVTITNIMICTKAAFGVSQKFVPYCKLSKIVANITKTITTSATLDFAGLTYNVPADVNRYLRVTAWAKASGKNPETIAIATTTGAILGYSAFPTDTTNSCISTSCIINTGSNATIDLKVKYNGVGSNHTVGMIVEEI